MRPVSLDPAQRTAVDHVDGACLVVAGPGSGKTRVIVERFLALLDRGVGADEVLVLTYTNKAASEMRERVETARGGFIGEAPLSTFHAFSGRVLRDWGWLIGIAPTFRIADDAERWLHMEAVLRELRPRTLWNALRPHDLIDPLLKLVEGAKQELVPPARYAQWVADKRATVTDATDAILLDRDAECAAVYATLQERYRRLGVLDHDDTILYAEELLREHPGARRAVNQRIRYVMVDEYQDTNFAQARLVETLVDAHGNLLVVADDDQAIYKFRGASLANLDRFKRTYPEFVQVDLGTNYRSTPEIVTSSRAVIGAAAPATRIPKQINAVREPGRAVEVWLAPDERAEADAVAAECAALISAGTPASDIAWLFRRHADMQAAIHALTAHGVVHQVHGGRGYFQQTEIKDMLALLGAVADIRDSQAVLRCLLMPVWRMSPRGRMALVAACADHDTPLATLVDGVESIEGLDDGDAQAARRCVDAIVELHARAPRDDVRDLFFDALDASGYLGVLDEADEHRRRQMGANLNKFGELLEKFADWSDDRRVATTLHYLGVLRDAGAADELAATDAVEDGVTLLTAHSAKGLEWPVVFIANCVEKRWPGRPGFATRLSLPDELIPEPPPAGDGHIDEERRLFYVAATRARDRLVFTAAQRYPATFRNDTEHPSPFLDTLRDAAGVTWREVPPLTELPGRRRRNVLPREAARLRVSVSDVATFKACPRQFEYRRRYRLPVRTNVQGWYGSLMHAVLQDAGQRRKSGQAMAGAELVRLWNDAWTASKGPKGTHAELRDVGEAQLLRYCDSPAWHDASITAVESSFALATTTADVVGRFDRIDRKGEHVTVIDYKTGPPRDAEALSRDLQVRAYAVAAAQIDHVDDIGVELHYLQTGEVVRVDLDKQRLDTAFRNLSATTGEINNAWNSGVFEAKPSTWTCRRCDYRTVCDEGRAAARG